MEALEQRVGYDRGWQWRDQNYAIGIVLMSLLPALGMVGALFCCFPSWLWASKCRLDISNIKDKFLLTNDDLDWFIYFIVILCRIRLLFTGNITNFNNYLIYIMKIACIYGNLVYFEDSSSFWARVLLQLVVYLHFGLIGWFLHDAGIRLPGIFEQFLVLEVLF